MVFPIHSKSILGLVFCLVNEKSLNCTSGLVLLCLFNSSSPSMIFATMDISISVTSALRLKFVCVTSFVLLLGQLRDLPHSKMTSEFT